MSFHFLGRYGQSTKRIGSTPQAECAGTCKKRGRPRADDVADYGTKKVKVSYQDCDLQKDLTMWDKASASSLSLPSQSEEKTGNKPELIDSYQGTHG